MTRFLDKSPTRLERLTAEKKCLQIELDRIGPGSIRDRLQELREIHVATNINEWLSSSGLRAPV